MSIKQFKKKLIKMIEKDGDFITWDNSIMQYGFLTEEELIVCGEGEKEIFTFKIVKV